ncbi:MAG: hypothetical protein DI562_05555 [Stenotrophomonas acidaminiphila]|nr:MAG: hypothetical protein DI562_05555 [Stenotrophomonas acidaminiphila]
MLAYFPQIYPGELLYSVLARYHRHMGTPSPIQSMEALFGRRLIVASVDLPGYLQVLADRLPPNFGWTADRIIDELTLLPYYTAFQPPSVERLARKAMLRGQTDGLLMRLGMAAFRVGRVTRLQFCSSCLRQMQERHGEYYWRRDHQLPGVLVCPDHGCSLQTSTVAVTARGRHTHVAADRKTCRWNAPAKVRGTTAVQSASLQRLAQASRVLLELREPTRTRAEWTRYYRQGVQRAGLAYSVRRVDQQRLQQQFREHHRGALKLLPELMAGQSIRGDWLPAMVRKHRNAFHPFQHVLLQDFLDKQEEHASPFGKGPWPCLNPLARHRGKPKISEVGVHRNHGHQVGVFACNCGYVYTRSYYEGSGTIGPPRFQAYGPMLAPVMGELIGQRHSLRAVAHRLELDPKTVVKLAGALGLATPWKSRPEGKAKKRIPLRAIVDQPIRKSRGNRDSVCLRFDWDELDKQVGRQVKRAAQEIRSQVPLVRVSTLQIERHCWNRGWLSKRAGKLPMAMQCLRDVVESVEQFQHRRLGWVIQEMDQADEPLQVWRILRRSGLKATHADLVKLLLGRHFDAARRQAA